MSKQIVCNFPVRKQNCRRKTVKDSENCDPLQKPTVRRVLFGIQSQSVSPRKSKATDELFGNQNQVLSPKKAKASGEDTPPNIRLCKQDTSPLQRAKQAFHTGFPSRVVGRDKEIKEVEKFIVDHLKNKKPGSMYISGAPGTGKTSSLMHIMKNIDNDFSSAFINCMSVHNPTIVYKSIARELGLPGNVVNSKNIVKLLENHITSSNQMNVLILDEIDQLDSKGQEILYSLFEWPHLANSMLILIGVANALDLTDRVLPRLYTFKCQPKLVNFPPYTKDKIVSILEDRLRELDSKLVIKPIAIQLCARKIAACSGDIRKALDVCRRAIEIVENRSQKQLVLHATSDDRRNPGSPMKRPELKTATPVDLQEITAVLHKVYGSRLVTSVSTGETMTMPLQQMLLLCTLVLMKKSCKLQDFTLGKSYDIYKRICQKRQIGAVTECEFHNICKLVESRGFLQLKSNKIARMTKVILKIDECEAEHVMQDKALLPAILADRSVLSR